MQNTELSHFVRFKAVLIRGKQCTSAPDIDTMPISNNSPGDIHLQGVFCFNFGENENAHSTQMMALWLNCDHTYWGVS